MGKSRIWLNLALRVMGTTLMGNARGHLSGSSSHLSSVSELAQGRWRIWGQPGPFAAQQGSPTPRGASRFWSSSAFYGASDPANRIARLAAPVGDRHAAAGPLMDTRRTFATKLKHPKVKSYSSYKLRFRGLANGLYKRWKAGKRHNAHSKSTKQQRQLRQPTVCPPGLAKAMKYLNFRQ